MGFVFSKMLGKPLFRSAYYVVSRNRNIKTLHISKSGATLICSREYRDFIDDIVNTIAFSFVF